MKRPRKTKRCSTTTAGDIRNWRTAARALAERSDLMRAAAAELAPLERLSPGQALGPFRIVGQIAIGGDGCDLRS